MTAPTLLTVTDINRAGAAPASFATSDHTNGNSIPNDGHTWLEFSNTDSGSHSVTIAVNRKIDGQTVTPTSHAIAAGAQLRCGPYPTDTYGDHLIVTTTDNTLKIAAYRLAH